MSGASPSVNQLRGSLVQQWASGVWVSQLTEKLPTAVVPRPHVGTVQKGKLEQCAHVLFLSFAKHLVGQASFLPRNPGQFPSKSVFSPGF